MKTRELKELFGESEFSVRYQFQRFDGWRISRVRRLLSGWVAVIYRWR